MGFIKSTRNKALILYNIFFIVFSIAFYFIIPEMLNYPPNSINNEFEKMIDSGMNYYQQYIIVIALAMILANTFVLSQIRGIDKWKKAIEDDDEGKLKKIKEKCFKIPYRIYILQATVPTIMISFIMYVTKTDGMLILKTAIMMFAFTILLGLVSYIFSKKFCNDILVELKNTNKYSGRVKLGIKNKLFLQFFPLIFVAVLFSLIISNAMMTEERGNLIFESYKEVIDHTLDKETYTEEELIKEIKTLEKRNKNDNVFVTTENDAVFTENNKEISDFMIKYSFNVAKENDGHTYDYYGTDIQGSVKYFVIGEQEYAAGVIYNATSENSYMFLGITLFLMIAMCLFFLWYFSQDISESISNVSLYMSKIVKHDEIDYEQKLPVTSNDEMGELIIRFNEMLDLEKENIETIKSSQTALVEQERLATIGQLAGGMAHDINTPLATVSQVLSYFDEYEELKDEDSKKMLAAAKISVEKISKIVNSVRNQIRNIGTEKQSKFMILDVVKNVEAILFSEIKKNNCKIEIIEKDSITLVGDMVKLEQVIMNFILNATQAYGEKGEKNGIISVIIYKKDQSAIIQISDEAGGIPSKIAESLFKQILTTKGTKGTGFGLYFSNSIIKGVFNGKIEFTTEEGIGTNFRVILPINKNY